MLIKVNGEEKFVVFGLWYIVLQVQLSTLGAIHIKLGV
jgi:hypothetical protein